MPQPIHYYEPDAIDCNTLVGALANDFGVLPEIETRYERDTVVVLVRCRKPADWPDGVVQVQAMVKAPLKSRRNLYTMQYSALLDCWHQLDRGALAIAKVPIEYSWNGRPRAPRRHD